MPTRTPGRPSNAGRFARQQASANRFGRPQQSSAGRRAKPASHKPANRRSTPTPWLTSRQASPKRSKGNAALNGVMSKLPKGVLAKAAKPSAASGGSKKKMGGMALLAGAAGLAMKKRSSGKAEGNDVVVAPADPVTPVTTASATGAPEAPVSPVVTPNGSDTTP